MDVDQTDDGRRKTEAHELGSLTELQHFYKKNVFLPTTKDEEVFVRS